MLLRGHRTHLRGRRTGRHWVVPWRQSEATPLGVRRSRGHAGRRLRRFWILPGADEQGPRFPRSSVQRECGTRTPADQRDGRIRAERHGDCNAISRPSGGSRSGSGANAPTGALWAAHSARMSTPSLLILGGGITAPGSQSAGDHWICQRRRRLARRRRRHGGRLGRTTSASPSCPSVGRPRVRRVHELRADDAATNISSTSVRRSEHSRWQRRSVGTACRGHSGCRPSRRAIPLG